MARIDSNAFWNRMAKKYAAARIRDMDGYERTLERTRALLRPADHVLEIGCGTGTTALRIAPSVARLAATDAAEGMIAIAREKLAGGDFGHVAFTVAAAEAAQGEGAFDAVLAFNVLHLVTDRDVVLARIFEALKPGGLLISKTPCLAEMNVLIRLAVPVAQWFGKAPPVDFLDAAALAAAIEAAGFTLTETARHGSSKKDPRIFIVARKPL